MDKLKVIAQQLRIIGIPYEFQEWTGENQYPYFVGEIIEQESISEDGLQESTMILTGTHRGKAIDLEECKSKIRDCFHPINGLVRKDEEGVVAIFYGNAFYVPTNEMDMKRIQINLSIKEWRV